MTRELTITITRQPDFWKVWIPLALGTQLAILLLFRLIHLPDRERPIASGVVMLIWFGSMLTVGLVTGYFPQGKLELHGDTLRAEMRFRRTRVFDLASTSIHLEKWIGRGGVRSGPKGPMLVFDEGQKHFRVGCFDYEASRLLEPGPQSDWFLREAHGATRCVDFYALADALGIDVPRPPGWQLEEVF